jgi:hypothetical protein
MLNDCSRVVFAQVEKRLALNTVKGFKGGARLRAANAIRVLSFPVLVVGR